MRNIEQRQAADGLFLFLIRHACRGATYPSGELPKRVGPVVITGLTARSFAAITRAVCLSAPGGMGKLTKCPQDRRPSSTRGANSLRGKPAASKCKIFGPRLPFRYDVSG
jgi:hypothetical protein